MFFFLQELLPAPLKPLTWAATRGPPGSTEASASFPPHFFGIRAASPAPPPPLVGVLYQEGMFLGGSVKPKKWVVILFLLAYLVFRFFTILPLHGMKYILFIF
jgi:hypothetical protein